MIVEYVDWDPGSGWSIKIYNPTAQSIDLSNYYVQVFNGANTSASGSEQLSGNLNSGANVIVSNAANGQASADFRACADDIRTNLVGVNDDDCIALTLGNGTNFVDMVGLYGVSVKNRVNGVGNALKWQKLVRNNGNCTRYTSTNGTSANSWPASSSVSVGGWSVLAVACLGSGNTFSPYSQNNVQNQSICFGDSLLYNGSYIKTAGSYFDTIFGANGCGQINRLNLNVDPAPQDRKEFDLCRNDSISIYNQWYRSDTNFILSRSNPGSCDSIIEIEITVEGPSVNFSWFHFPEDSSRIQFSDQSYSLNTNRLWYFGDGSSSIEIDPLHHFQNPGSYPVSLVLIDSITGCKDSLSYLIFIPNSDLLPPLLPNIFTPNGDGMNDFYHLEIDKGPADFNVAIIDRYGLLVFESKDPRFEWDGRYQGNLLGSGTYFIQVQWNGEILKKFLSLQR